MCGDSLWRQTRHKDVVTSVVTWLQFCGFALLKTFIGGERNVHHQREKKNNQTIKLVSIRILDSLWQSSNQTVNSPGMIKVHLLENVWVFLGRRLQTEG